MESDAAHAGTDSAPAAARSMKRTSGSRGVGGRTCKRRDHDEGERGEGIHVASFPVARVRVQRYAADTSRTIVACATVDSVVGYSPSSGTLIDPKGLAGTTPASCRAFTPCPVKVTASTA